MSFWRRKWRPHHLLLSWCAYWVVLVLVKLGPAFLAGWRMSQQPQGKGDVSVGMGNGTITATIADAGRTTWAGSISVLTLALLIAGPPLVLWLAWLVGSSRTNNAEKNRAEPEKMQRELDATDSRAGIIDSSTLKRRAREES
jgi:threonine/homoserine/homoserine lactone efflux protein